MVDILQLCADGWQVLSGIAQGLRGPGCRTCDRGRPGVVPGGGQALPGSSCRLDLAAEVMQMHHLPADSILNPASIRRWITISAACSGSMISAGKSPLPKRSIKTCCGVSSLMAYSAHRAN